MRILIVHNAYQLKGGEDTVVESELALLRAQGVDVAEYRRDNDDINGMSRLSLVKNTLWSDRTEDEIAHLIKNFVPDVIHAHNTFPLISPSLYWAAKRGGIPVVQTLHNFRQSCLSGVFLREGMVCEDCMGRLPWRGVVRKCYRGSSAQSAVLAGMLALHRGLGTYRDKVTRYIALSEFSRNKFIECGFRPESIVVKPNFVDFPVPDKSHRKGFLYVGRLSVEKGVHTLVKAVTLLNNFELRVAGDGPEAYLLDGVADVTRLGNISSDTVRREMNTAVALVLPSICYESFPRTIVEAFASGLPVIASRIGAMAELIEDGKTGLLFDPGSAEDLARKIVWAETNPKAMLLMGTNARREYEAKYTSEQNFGQLMAIYAEAIEAEAKFKKHEPISL